MFAATGIYKVFLFKAASCSNNPSINPQNEAMILLSVRKDHQSLTFIKHMMVSKVISQVMPDSEQTKTTKPIPSTTSIFNKDNPHVVHMKRNNLNIKIMKQNQDTSKRD